MKTQRKHGFTIVELVVVIAVIAILAAVLIPTFVSIIKKANNSAYLQERTSQQIADLAEKVENQNYLTWEDFEAVLARELAKVGSTQTADIQNAIKMALAERAGTDNGLSEAQVQKIINEAMSGQLTTAQVQAIVEQSIKNAGISVGTSGGVTAAQVQSIVSAAIANIPTQTGVTPAMVQSAVASALANAQVTAVTEDDIKNALKAFGVSTLTEEQIVEIAKDIALEVSDKTGNEKIVATLNIRAAGNEKATLYDTFVAMSISNPTTAVKSISAGETILWDSEDKKFVLDSDGSHTGARYWTVSDDISTEWSTYYTGTASTISTTKGFDAGTTTSVTSVTYSNTGSAQNVVIRTNGGTLTIDAKNDNVLHYGYADSVNVIDVATASYHENGTVKFLEVAAGHIVLEKDSDVSAVHFDATNEKFENADGKTISIDLSKVNANDISFSRDAVTIAENGTYVAEVTTDGTEYIWLFGNGIKEQMVVTTTEGAIAENGTLNSGITAGAEDGSVAEQIANPAKRNEQGQLVDNDNNPVTVENAVVEEVASKEDVQAGATLFAGGTGTENDPYLIASLENMMAIDDLFDITNTNSRYYKFVANITDDNGNYNSWTTYIDAAVIDLNGYTLNINKENTVFYVHNSATIKNGTLNYLKGTKLINANGDVSANVTLKFDNLVLSGDINVTAAHYGPLVQYLYAASFKGTYTLNANNVINNMHIVNTTGDTGGMFGYIQGTKISASVTNCTMNGSIQGNNVGGFFNTCSYPEAVRIVNSGNILNGSLLGSGNVLAFGLNSNYDPDGDSYQAQNNLVVVSETAKLAKVSASNSIIVAENIGDEIKINHSNTTVSYYLVEIEYWVNRKSDGSGGYPRTIMKRVDVTNTGTYSTGFFKNKYEQVSSDASSNEDIVYSYGNCKVWKAGDTYKIYDPDYVLSSAKSYIRIYGYKGDGTLVTYQTESYMFK